MQKEVQKEVQTVADALAEYIAVLADSLHKTSRTEDRPRYVEHLAEAAVLFSLVHRGAPRHVWEAKVHQEQRAFGLGFLSGLEGKAAESAFAALAAVVLR